MDAVRAWCPVPADTVCVYTAGSTVSGWSHANSDVDLYVITDTDALPAVLIAADAAIDFSPGEAADAAPRLSVPANGRRRQWDVEYWTVEQLASVFARFEHPLLAVSLLEDAPFTDADVEFAHRFRTAVALFGDDWLDHRRASVNWTQVFRAVLHRKLDIVDSLVNETLGQLADDAVEDAALTVHVAFGHAVDALTLASGVLSVKPRWRVARMRAVAPPELPWETYWRHETMSGYDEDPRRWIVATAEVCRELLLEIDEDDLDCAGTQAPSNE